MFDGADLIAAVQELSSVDSIADVQRIVRTYARRIANADGATFVLMDGDQCYYADEDAIEPLWKGQRFPLSACVSGWVMQNRQAAAIPDIYADPRVPQDAYRPTFVKSMAMVPVREADPIAAIGVYWARPFDVSPQVLAALQALANSTSVAITHAQTLSSLERRERSVLEDHRERIATDLINDVTPRLFGSQLELSSALALITDPAARDRVAAAISGLDTVAAALRSAVLGVSMNGREHRPEELVH